MALNIDIPKPDTFKPKITIFGVGGAGGNAVNNMINSRIEGVEFVAANTDAQALEHSIAENKIQLGEKTTKGLGAGSFPDRGRVAAEENIEEIEKLLEGNHMIFIAAGMGGGTGTGAAPVIAKLAKDRDILTVGVVTKPFHFEGKYRMETAENGIEELKKNVDTLIVIPNQNLFRIANEKTTFESAFKMADDVLNAGVRGVTDLITMPGLVNLDFADIRTVMTKMGKAMMGTGEGEGENRAIDACEAAISNPLLDDISIRGAKGVLVNMTGGPDMTLFEADMAVNAIRKEVDDNANIIFGSAFDENMKGKIRVSVVATGIDEDEYRKNIIRDNSSDTLTSRFKSMGSNFLSGSSLTNKEEPEERSFFNPATITPPAEKTVKKISADFHAKSEYTEEENLGYGKADKKLSDKKIQSAISQISFFNDDDKDESQEDEDQKDFSARTASKDSEKKKPKKKQKEGSGFSLFSFMSGGSKNNNDDQEDEDLYDNDEHAQKLESLIGNNKKSEQQKVVKVVDLDEEKEESEKNSKNQKNKIEEELDSQDQDNDLDDFEQELDQEDEISEKKVDLTDGKKYNSGKAANDSGEYSEDDLLNVPAFFRRKK